MGEAVESSIIGPDSELLLCGVELGSLRAIATSKHLY